MSYFYIYQLFCDFENFMSVFAHLQLWASAHFLEVICNRYDPVYILDTDWQRNNWMLINHFSIDKIITNKKGLELVTRRYSGYETSSEKSLY